MTTNLFEAHKQWAIRAPDERFSNLEDLIKFKQIQRENSKSQIINLGDLKLGIEKNNGLNLNGSSDLAYFTNWSFGQLCRILGAPAKYLRTLPNIITRDCLQHSLSSSRQLCQLLKRETLNKIPNSPENQLAAFTGPQYGRIWDIDIIESLAQAIEGTAWHQPLNYSNQPSGLYASDHDMFAFMISEDNPIKIGDSELKRGFFCWNSETGAASFGLTTFLYNSICNNHIVWGAEQINELRIYHRKQAPERFYKEAIPSLNRFVENKDINEHITKSVDQAMNQKIGNNEKDVLNWFKNKPFTQTEIINGRYTGIGHGEDVTNLWGMIQGLTAYARDIPYIDKKVNLEKRAGALLM